MKHTKTPRGRLVLTGVAIGLAGLMAMLSATTMIAAASVNAGSINIGYENNGADPSIISVANGYFQKELGSQVQLKLFSSGPAALSALASGALPFMCGLGFPPVIAALAKQVPLQVVFNQERYTQDAGLVVRSSSGITTVAQLKGKTVAIVIGSQSSFELADFVKAAGISLSSIHELDMSPPEMQSAWATGQIQAAIVWDPVFDYLSSHGGRILASDANLPPTATSFNICVANKGYAAAHPVVAAAFEKALGDGVNYLNAHPTQALAVMAKAAGITVATAKTEIAGYDIFSLSDQTSADVLGSGKGTGSSGTAQSLLNNWKVLYAAGVITTAPPASAAAYVNSTYAAEAISST
jgi:NitT/TauT family transport system substrate-binding protein/taurine transport system substrate-binding protein